MAQLLIPTLVIGLGGSGKRTCAKVADSISIYEKTLLRAYQFIFVSQDLPPTSKEAPLTQPGKFVISSLHDIADKSVKEEQLRKLLKQKIDYLLAVDSSGNLPYSLIGRDGRSSPQIRVFVVQFLEDPRSDNLFSCINSTLLDCRRELARGVEMLLYPVFCITRGEISFNFLKDITLRAEKEKENFVTRVLLVSEMLRQGTLINLEEKEDLISLFLESILLSDIYSSEIKFKLLDSLDDNLGETEAIYCSLGVSAVYCPLDQIIRYCSENRFCQLVERITRVEGKHVDESDRTDQNHMLRMPIPAIEVKPGPIKRVDFSIFDSSDEKAKEIKEQFQKWNHEIIDYRARKLDKLSESVNNLKRDIHRSAEDRIKEIEDNLTRIVESSPNGLRHALNFLKKRLLMKEKTEELVQSTKDVVSRLQPVPKGILDPSLLQNLLAYIQAKPNANAVIFHGFLFFAITGFLCLSLFRPLHIHLIAFMLSSIFLLFIAFLAVFLIIYIPNSAIRKNYNNLIKKINSTFKNIDRFCLSNIEIVRKICESKALEHITSKMTEEERKLDLLIKLLEHKTKKFARQLEHIRNSDKQVINDTTFRKYVRASGRDFERIYQGEKPLEEKIDEFLTEFARQRWRVLSPYDFFEALYKFAEKDYSRMKKRDYLSNKESEEMFKQKIQSLWGKTSTYLPIVPELNSGRNIHPYEQGYISGHKRYKDSISKTIPAVNEYFSLMYFNRLYFWKITDKIPFKIIDLIRK